MNVAIKKVSCLDNIPKRNGQVAKPKPAKGCPHDERVTKAVITGFIRYNKALEELSKV